MTTVGICHSVKAAASTVDHNDTVRAINVGGVSVLVLLDLSTAFESVYRDVPPDVLDLRFGVEDGALPRTGRTYLPVRNRFVLSPECHPTMQRFSRNRNN